MRMIATLLAFAVVHVSFGPQAWAQVVGIGSINAPVSGSAAAGSLTLTAPSASVTPAATFNPSLNGGLSGSSFAPSPVQTGARAASAFVPGAMAAQPVAAAAAEAARVSAVPAALTPSAMVSAAPSKDETPKAEGVPAAKTPSSETAPVTLQAGPKTGRVASKAAAIISGVRAYFGGKSVEAVPAAKDAVALGEKPLAAAHAPELTPDDSTITPQAGAPVEPPAPVQPKASAAAKRSINWFLGGMLVAQVGVEILGLAMPLLMREKFGGFSALAHIAVWSSAASIVGQLIGGWVANKFGIKGTYIGATMLRLVSISAMVVFLMGPTAPMVAAVPLLAKFAALLNGFSSLHVLVGFYSFNGFMAGLAGTAQKSIPNAILGNDRATLEKFSSLQQWLLEIVGVSGPKAGGLMVQTFGFTSAIAVYPVMLLIAVGMYAFGLRIPKDGATEIEPAQGKSSKFGATVRAILAPLAPMHNAFGKALAAISAFVDKLVLKAYLGRWIEKLGGKGKLTDTDEQNLLTRSTLGWTLAAMFSMVGFLTMLLPFAFPAYVAMVVFGVAEVIASQKLYSLLLSRTKNKAEAVKVNAVAGASFAAIYTLALNLTGMLFDKATGITPFLIFNAALVPLAAAVYFLYRMIKRTDAKGSPEPVVRPKGGFGLLFKDPMMRWAFLTFVALSVMNPLLYQIISQAFGLLVVGGNATAASGVASWITALYSFGGLLGALYMWRESSLISEAKQPAPPAPPAAPTTK